MSCAGYSGARPRAREATSPWRWACAWSAVSVARAWGAVARGTRAHAAAVRELGLLAANEERPRAGPRGRTGGRSDLPTRSKNPPTGGEAIRDGSACIASPQVPAETSVDVSSAPNGSPRTYAGVSDTPLHLSQFRQSA